MTKSPMKAAPWMVRWRTACTRQRVDGLGTLHSLALTEHVGTISKCRSPAHRTGIVTVRGHLNYEDVTLLRAKVQRHAPATVRLRSIWRTSEAEGA